MITYENAKWLYKCGLYESLSVYNHRLDLNAPYIIKSGIIAESYDRYNAAPYMIWEAMSE